MPKIIYEDDAGQQMVMNIDPKLANELNTAVFQQYLKELLRVLETEVIRHLTEQRAPSDDQGK
jgi:hypothetical protein